MSTHVIGTAGHIDHGKSTLVKALTGINPDRLKEEQEREMTIDLGFAYLKLPSGKTVSIVDVPGHERFIRNMLAGASGIDLVLFVVAADEGMMPQSREHLDILNLLQLKQGIIVLTKIDLVDEDWIKLIEEDIREEVEGTFLENAPIFRVSSVTGEGLSELVSYIDTIIDKIEKRPLDAPARYPIDRIFKVAGFGTVVTGTLWEGRIALGQELTLLPQDITVKVRNLQTHGMNVQSAEAAVRLAINISGAEKAEIVRGDVLVEPGYYKPTKMIDAELTVLEDAYPILHAEKVHFYLGTRETLGKIRILYSEKLEPGEKGYVQIILEDPVVARRGDRFIIRRFSPVVTIGGGVVIDPYPERKRLQEKSYLVEFELYKNGQLKDIVVYLLDKAGFNGLSLNDLKFKTAERDDLLKNILDACEKEGIIFKLADTYFSSSVKENGKIRIINTLNDFFKKNSFAIGMDREELRSRAAIENRKLYGLILNEMLLEGLITLERDLINIPGRTASLSDKELSLKKEIEEKFLKSFLTPPSPEELLLSYEENQKMARNMFNLLVEEGILVKITPEIYLHKDAVEHAVKKVKELFNKKEKITIKDIKDILGVSRKYAVPIAEYLDKIKLTRRIGNERILANKS